MNKLFIVEAPGKVKTISNYLNQIEPGQWVVKASVGHIRELHKDRFSIDLTTFKPSYVVSDDKKKVVAELVQLSKKCRGGVYIATDLDREGEAIAWHIASVLGIRPDQSKRIVYNEISKSSIAAALTNIRTIDMNRVVSQEARRFVDRIVGYTVSPMLHKIINSKSALSGGRVQSVVLMMIQERCNKIKNFRPVFYYGVKALFNTNSECPFKATWVSERYHTDGYMINQQLVQEFHRKVSQSPHFQVTDIIEKPVIVQPPKPFTTSLLQQVASKKLGISVETVMKIAQKLYEKGLISYMRTDSHSLSDDFVQSVRKYISNMEAFSKMPGLLPNHPNVFKSKSNAQEAHEAIRPTNIEVLSSEIEDASERQLYDLIRDTTIACQMAAGQDLSSVVHLVHNQTNEPFVIKGRVVKFLGWRSLMLHLSESDEGEKDSDVDGKLPVFSVGQHLTADSVDVTSDKTKPPAYFTEATLVKEMERNNIGRPATTASLIKVNFLRGYIAEEGSGKKAKIVITDLGDSVCNSLIDVFTFMDVKYTSQLEDALDLIASGKAKFSQVMAMFCKTFDGNLGAFCKKHSLPDTPLMSFSDDITKSTKELKLEKHPEGSVVCPKCTIGYLRSIDGKFGTFWGCSERSGRKKCDAIFENYCGTPYLAQHNCPQCNKNMRLMEHKGSYQWTCVDKVSCGFYTLARDDGSPKF